MTLRVRIIEAKRQLREPFEIAGRVFIEMPVLYLELADRDGHIGCAEAAGVDYEGETTATMRAQLDAVVSRLSDATTPADIQSWLPRGGARNALDCALWDLQAKRSGVPAWQAAGLPSQAPRVTASNIGLGSPAYTRRQAQALAGAQIIKLKVDAKRHLELVRAVREVAPKAELWIDANQSWSRPLLVQLLPELLDLRISLIEQPVKRGEDAQLDGLRSPIPLVADESCMDRQSLPNLVSRYQGVNIKLDKTGGLTEALALAGAAQEQGLALMAGNMCGSSLGIAPAFLIAQLARWVDLDGPRFLRVDHEPSMRYADGALYPPMSALWG
jgi:L-alanine-DL-glutamate epimerase-like enolase superfamily enzyme